MPRKKPRPDDQKTRKLFQYLPAKMHCKRCGFYFADLHILWNEQANACTLCEPHPELPQTDDEFDALIWRAVHRETMQDV